jgi:hypothetical protein
LHSPCGSTTTCRSSSEPFHRDRGESVTYLLHACYEGPEWNSGRLIQKGAWGCPVFPNRKPSVLPEGSLPTVVALTSRLRSRRFPSCRRRC